MSIVKGMKELFLIILHYSKEKLIYLPLKWKLSSQIMTKIANQGFSLSLPPLPLPSVL